MVNIKEAINDTVMGIGEEADCMLIIVKKDETIRSGVIGIDDLGISPNAVVLAKTMKVLLDGTLKVASDISDALDKHTGPTITEVARVHGASKDREKNMKELINTAEERAAEIKAKDEARDAAAKDAVRGFFHKVLNDIIDEAIGGDDDEDDD